MSERRRFDLLAEHLSRPVQAGFHRCLWDAEQLADLLATEALEISQDDHLAIERLEASDRFVNRMDELPSRDGCLGTQAVGRELRGVCNWRGSGATS